MRIVWFDNEAPEGCNLKKDKATVKAWARDNDDVIHGIIHLVEETEMEAVKILAGEQGANNEGKVMLRTLELHFMKGLVVIERVVEVQEPGSFTTKSTSTQIGYLDACCSGDDCCCPRPKEK